eukprot:2790463-Alexandrium_andersonii.AAC.1
MGTILDAVAPPLPLPPLLKLARFLLLSGQLGRLFLTSFASPAQLCNSRAWLTGCWNGWACCDHLAT